MDTDRTETEVQLTDDTVPEESTAASPRMSRTQTLTLIVMASVNFSSMACFSILGPFFPHEAEKKGVSQTIIGLIFGVYALGNLLGSLVLGRYIVQIGAKFMIIVGLFVSAGCTILFGLLDRVSEGKVFIILCFVVRSIEAVGVAGAVTSSFAISAKVFPNNIATVLGFLEVFTGLGLILGPPLGGWLYQSYGYEIPFIALGCFLFLNVPFIVYILPTIDADPIKDSFLRLCTNIKVLIICFVVFTLSSGLGFLDATLSIFAINTFHLSAVSVGLLMIAMSLPYGAASPVFGIISDKYPFARKWMMVFGGLATAISFCLLGPIPILHIQSQLWLTILMLVVIGFSLCLTCIPTISEMLNCAYEIGFEEGLSTLGLVSGLFSAVWSAGMFFGPTIGGIITEALNFEWAASIQGGLAFLAAFLQSLYFLSEEIHRKRSRVNGKESTEASTDVTPALLIPVLTNSGYEK